MSLYLQELFFGTFQVPENFTTRKHSICGNPNKKKPAPLNSKQKILNVLNNVDWKTNKQIASDTGLLINRVQHTTAKLFNLGKIERTAEQPVSTLKPIYLYRIKNENLG